MVYKIIFEYNGANFFGLERQKNLTTIAGAFEKGLNQIFAEKLKVVYASRTDKGVSAFMQVASFESDKKFNLETLKYKLNRLLDASIKVKAVEFAPADFRANKNVLCKTYRYSLFLAPMLLPLEGEFCAHCYKDLNIKAIKKASKFFVGTHDFSAFCSADCEKENKVRTILKFKITEQKIKDNFGTYKKLNFYITGNGFLQHMVRIIVGTLIDVGTGKIAVTDIPELLKSKTRTKTQNTMPATGLMLMEIMYK